MNVFSLTARQVRYTNKTFWRNPASAFFTFAFPLMFLVIFTALLGSGTVHLAGRTVKESTYYVAAMAAFAVISACYTNVAMTVTFQRDAGILKRVDGTPLPAGVYFAARVLHALFVAILLVVITAAFGRLAYQASVPTGITLVHFLVMLIVGAGSFCALGFAITTVIPNADALGGSHLPCPALRSRDAGRLFGHQLRLGRRRSRRRLGSGRAAYRHIAVQLGATNMIRLLMIQP
jgi:ABC-2 type transport system permease protein